MAIKNPKRKQLKFHIHKIENTECDRNNFFCLSKEDIFSQVFVSALLGIFFGVGVWIISCIVRYFQAS